MNRILLSIFLIIGILNADTKQLSVTNAKISFEFVSKEVKGTIEGFKSSSVIDFDTPENSVFEGSVAVETLDTNNSIRNWHLKRGKYFDKDDFPKISFKSTSVTLKDDTYIVEGNLNLKGITRPIEINFVKKGNQLKGETSIYSFDYGIKIKKKREDNLVNVTLLFDL